MRWMATILSSSFVIDHPSAAKNTFSPVGFRRRYFCILPSSKSFSPTKTAPGIPGPHVYGFSLRCTIYVLDGSFGKVFLKLGVCV